MATSFAAEPTLVVGEALRGNYAVGKVLDRQSATTTAGGKSDEKEGGHIRRNENRRRHMHRQTQTRKERWSGIERRRRGQRQSRIFSHGWATLASSGAVPSARRPWHSAVHPARRGLNPGSVAQDGRLFHETAPGQETRRD